MQHHLPKLFQLVQLLFQSFLHFPHFSFLFPQLVLILSNFFLPRILDIFQIKCAARTHRPRCHGKFVLFIDRLGRLRLLFREGGSASFGGEGLPPLGELFLLVRGLRFACGGFRFQLGAALRHFVRCMVMLFRGVRDVNVCSSTWLNDRGEERPGTLGCWMRCCSVYGTRLWYCFYQRVRFLCWWTRRRKRNWGLSVLGPSCTGTQVLVEREKCTYGTIEVLQLCKTD